MPTKPALEKRVSSRRKVVVPLRSFGANKPVTVVHTLDLSITGAKLGAVREHVQAGDMLIVQRKHKRSKCRVVWVRDMGRGEIHAGVELLGSDTDFWGLELEDTVGVVTTPAR